MTEALIIIAWFVCGVIAACGTYAHFQRKFALIADECRSSDIRLSLTFFCAGPFGLSVSALQSKGFKYGLLIPGMKP